MRLVVDMRVLSERGTSVACYDYARFAEELLGHDVIVAHSPPSGAAAEAVAQRFSSRFHCFAYADKDDLVRKASQEKADVLYRLIGGHGKAYDTKGMWLANHVVFRSDEVHGDVYAYVSEWLSELASGGVRPFVPHIVDLPEPGSDLRKALGIPADACVVGRHGGYDQFNLPFTEAVIEQILEERPDIWFVFLNTQVDVRHKRVIHLPATSNLVEKSDYINACDAMLHARKLGESFGLAMAEFVYFNKPVICWYGGIDRNHLRLQRDPSLVYFSARDLLKILRRFRKDTYLCEPMQRSCQDFRQRYSPETVMKTFGEVFMTPTTSDSLASRRERGITPTSRRVQIAGLLQRRAFKIVNEASVAVARLSVRFPLSDSPKS